MQAVSELTNTFYLSLPQTRIHIFEKDTQNKNFKKKILKFFSYSSQAN